jgi:hypothetical protein
MKRESKLKVLKTQVEDYLNKYRHMSSLLMHSDNELIKNIFARKKSNAKKASEFIKGVNVILNAMKKEHADLLVNFYVNHKSFEEMGYSKTHFYLTYREAIEEFIQIIE